MPLVTLGKHLDKNNLEIITLMSSRNVSHILTMFQRKYMPCQCQYISAFMDICYEPVFFWCLSIQALALKDLFHFQWRSMKQSKPDSVKCPRLQCQKCYSESHEVKLVQSIWLLRNKMQTPTFWYSREQNVYCGDDVESERKVTKHTVVITGCKAINYRS